MMEFTRFRLHRTCPHCGAEADHTTTPGNFARRPGPGDINLCRVCANIGLFLADGSILPTGDEILDRLQPADRALFEECRQAIRAGVNPCPDPQAN